MKNEKTEIIIQVKEGDRAKSLMQNVNIDTLKGTYRELMKNNVAVEIGAEYEKNLDKNFENLLHRMKNGSYFPQSQDWFEMEDIDGRCKKYVFRAFEDKILQHLFRKILEKIYEPKIQHSIGDLEKIKIIERPCTKKKVYVARTEVNIEKLLSSISQEHLINFLEQDIADRNFIRYCQRLLQGGLKLSGACTGIENESPNPFASMFYSTLVYYILQSLGDSHEWGLNGEMRMRRKDGCFRCLFDKVEDARMVYQRLYQNMKKQGIDVHRDKICTLSSVFDYKKQLCKTRPSKGNVKRLNNRGERQ